MANIHETEKRIGNFVKRTTGTALIVLGAGLGVNSTIEISSSYDVLKPVHQKIDYLSYELRREYGIFLECYVGPGATVACIDRVDGSYSKEQKDVIYQEYMERYRVGERRILESFNEKVIEEVRTKNRMGGIVFLIGLSVIGSGIAILKRRRE